MSEASAYALRLRGIRLHAHIGVGAAERANPQELLVDVDLDFDPAAVPARDRRSRATDYDRIVTLVVEESREPYRLLETYAARVLDTLLAETPAREARVAVTKVRVPTRHPVGQAIVELRKSAS